MPLASRYALFLSQLLCHLGLLCWLLLKPTWPEFFCIFGMYFLMGCFGMSCTYHRLLTHRSYKISTPLEVVGTFLGSIGLVGSSLAWTAAHQQHHQFTDQKNDPHSPSILGFMYSQWLSMFSSVSLRKSPVLSSRFHQFMHKYYFLINLTWATLLIAIFGYRSWLIFHLAPAAILWNAGSFINTFCHTNFVGYRNFETHDLSRNNFLFGFLVWGEGWHNNHHFNPKEANFRLNRFEFDISYFFIRLFRQKKY